MNHTLGYLFIKNSVLYVFFDRGYITITWFSGTDLFILLLCNLHESQTWQTYVEMDRQFCPSTYLREGPLISLQRERSFIWMAKRWKAPADKNACSVKSELNMQKSWNCFIHFSRGPWLNVKWNAILCNNIHWRMIFGAFCINLAIKENNWNPLVTMTKQQ